MTRSTRVGLLALVCAATTIWLLPSASLGRGIDLDGVDAALKHTTDRLAQAVQQTVAPASEALKTTAAKTRAELERIRRAEQAATRATATDPATQPPSHGSNPHGQGSVAVVDVNPSSERPLGSKPDGTDAGEDVIVGRPRGEQVNGAYHGHITILALLGQELAGVDSAPGETKTGPLDAVQTGVLDPLCTSTGMQVCLSVLTANSTTTATGSTNEFALARASVLGLGVGAAESSGTIGQDANCQTATGSARTANVSASGGGAIATVANSSSTSKSCRGAAPAVTNSSSVIGLGGTQVPLPAAGCANGTPDTVSGIPAVLPIVCNADDVAGALGVREALDVFVLQVGGASLAKETTAASESLSVAPAAAETTGPQCSDGIDNDGDGVIDAADPGCHSDGDASNPNSYNPNDTSERDATPSGPSGGETSGPECSDNRDNDGDGRIDERDPGCHTDGNPNNPDSYRPNDDDERNGGGPGAPQCSDGVDNDGDGVADAADPGCHTDGNPNNPDSYDPTDDSEADGGGRTSASLPLTGSNIVGLALAGLLLLAGGLVLRRREEAHAGA